MVCRSTPVGHGSFIKPKQPPAHQWADWCICLSPLWSELLLTELAVVWLHKEVWVFCFFSVDMICDLRTRTSFTLTFQHLWFPKNRSVALCWCNTLGHSQQIYCSHIYKNPLFPACCVIHSKWVSVLVSQEGLYHVSEVVRRRINSIHKILTNINLD